MTNQLLLAQILAEGSEAAQNSNALPWGTWVSSVIGLLGSLIVAWWSGRKIDKQMELSKQATPPELTRYKTWLEVSKAFKELEGVNDKDALAGSKEYEEIKASREVALERAAWERKVISECPNIQAQKLVMELPESKIYEIHHPDTYRGIELSADSYVKPKASGIMWLIYLIAFSSLPILMTVISGSLTENRWVVAIFSIIIFVLLFPMFRHVAPNQHNGIFEANYFLRKKRVDMFLEMRESEDELEDEDYSFNIFCKIDQDWEEWCRREGLRYASVFNTWAENINCPWVDKKCSRVWHRVRCYFCPGHYVKRSLNGEDEVLWGSYKEELLNGDLKKKLGRKNTQAPNSNVQEGSPPTPPQG